MDTLACMRLFVRVVQAGSFSAAGRQIGISPASVFRMINGLEDELGVRLLNRSSRKLTLTEAGELYSQKLEGILGEIEDANAAVSQLHLAPRGTLRVHTRVSLGIHHIAPLLPQFLAQYGELKIDLRLSEGPLDLAEHNIDVAIHVGDVFGSNLLVRKVASGPRVVCASPSYLSSAPALTRPEDLAEHNCMTFRAEENEPIWRFRKGKELIELAVSGNLKADNGDVLHVAALNGMGVVLLRTWSVGSDLKAGRLVRLLGGYEATPFGFDHDIHLVTQKSKHRSLKVRLFSEYMAKAFRKKRTWVEPLELQKDVTLDR